MMTVAPARKRRANKGRYHDAVVVMHGIINTPQGISAIREVCKNASAGSHKAHDAVICDYGTHDMGTMHRNRFAPDHVLAITAPNVAKVRSILKAVEHRLPKVKFEQRLGELGLITVKVLTNGADMVNFIANTKANHLFQVEEGFINR